MESYYRDKLRLIEAGPPGGAGGERGQPGGRRPHRRATRTGSLFGPEGRVRVDDDGWIEVDGHAVADAGLLRVPGPPQPVEPVRRGGRGAAARPDRSRRSDAVSRRGGRVRRTAVAVPTHRGPGTDAPIVDDALASNPFAIGGLHRDLRRPSADRHPRGADRGVDPDGPGGGPGRAPATGRGGGAAPGARPAGRDARRHRRRRRSGPVRTAPDLAGAVALAAALTPAGGVVLFSPGAPTPEGEGGYARAQPAVRRGRRTAPGPGDRAGTRRWRSPGPSQVRLWLPPGPGPEGPNGGGHVAGSPSSPTRSPVVDGVADPGRGTFLIDPADLPGALGWELKASRPVPGRHLRARAPTSPLLAGGRSARPGRRGRRRAASPSVVDLDAGIVAVALPAELRRRALADLDGPGVHAARPGRGAPRARRVGGHARSCWSPSRAGAAAATTCPGGRPSTTSSPPRGSR